MNTIYELSPEEHEKIHEIAKRIQAAKVPGTSKKFADSTDLRVTEIGVGGQYVFCKLVDLPTDFTPRARGDGGLDTTLPCGLTIDVKTRDSRDTDAALNGPDLSYLKTDIAAFMWPTDNRLGYQFMGWTTRVHLHIKGRIIQMKGPRLGMSIDELKKPWEFEKYFL